MTWKQWWEHFVSWVRCFPLKRDDDHTYVGRVGDDVTYLTCMICQKKTVETIDKDD